MNSYNALSGTCITDLKYRYLTQSNTNVGPLRGWHPEAHIHLLQVIKGTFGEKTKDKLPVNEQKLDKIHKKATGVSNKGNNDQKHRKLVTPPCGVS